MNTEQLIAQSVSEVPPSGIRKFFDIASDMKNVISMSVGEPDFVTPWNVCQAAIDSIERGETHYTSNSGMPELRALIEQYLAERFRVHYKPEQMLVTVGASEALDLAFRALLNPGDEVLIPNGDFVIHAGDRVHVAGDMVTITNYFRFLGKHSLRVKNVMLLGGGRISYYLAKMIVPMGMHVAMIEINPKKAESLSESLPHVNVILGDGTDQELLEQEGLESMDAFIAMCDRDEENLMTGLFAVKQGVPKVIVKNNRLAYADIMNGMGLDSMVSPKTITCSTILRYVRALVNSDGTKVERLYRLMNGRVEALEFIARASDSYIGIPLKNLHIRKNALVAVIARQGKVIVPFGDDKIEEGDHVVIIVCENGIGDLNEVISK